MFLTILKLIGPWILGKLMDNLEQGRVDAKTMKHVLKFIKDFEEKDVANQIDLDESLEEMDRDVQEWIRAKRAEKK